MPCEYHADYTIFWVSARMIIFNAEIKFKFDVLKFLDDNLMLGAKTNELKLENW